MLKWKKNKKNKSEWINIQQIISWDIYIYITFKCVIFEDFVVSDTWDVFYEIALR